MTAVLRAEKITLARIFHISLRPAILVKQASIGMFLVPSQASTNSGEHGRARAHNRREKTAPFSAPLEATKDEVENVKYPKPEPNPCVVTQGGRRRSRAVVFPLPPLVVNARLYRK